MAKLSVVGMDGLIVALAKEDEGIRKRITAAMDMAAGAVEETIREAGAKQFSGKKPGAPLESLVRRGPIINTGDSFMVQVWPQGSYTGIRGKPRRAETVAFVQEYGRSDMPAKPWIKPGTRKAKKKVNSILAEIVKGGST